MPYKLLRNALEQKGIIDRVAVLTGSGISAESGIATFRNNDGLWMNHRVEDVATYEGFLRNPLLVWEFYEQRRLEVMKTSPNDGHYALAELENALIRKNRKYTLCTQNVDGLHSKAGSVNILELHGNLREASCIECNTSLQLPEAPLDNIPPRCPACSKILRPRVVWFGEALDPDILDSAFRAMECDILIVAGTSLMVYPAAYFPILALKNGALVIEINIEKTPSSECFVHIRGKAGRVAGPVVSILQDYL